MRSVRNETVRLRSTWSGRDAKTANCCAVRFSSATGHRRMAGDERNHYGLIERMTRTTENPHLFSTVRHWLSAVRLSSDARLPPERELAEKFCVSRAELRKV